MDARLSFFNAVLYQLSYLAPVAPGIPGGRTVGQTGQAAKVIAGPGGVKRPSGGLAGGTCRQGLEWVHDSLRGLFAD